MSLITKSSKKVITYLLVGGLAFLGEYLTFYITWGISKNVVVSQSVSFLVGLTISFLGSRNVTFKANKRQGYRFSGRTQTLQFGALGAMNLLITNVGMIIIIDHLFVSPYLSKLVMMACVVIWNYTLFNWVIFKALK